MLKRLSLLWKLKGSSAFANNHVIHLINRIKEEKHVNISIDTEKAFNKIQYVSMIKTLNKVGIEGTYFNVIKTIYDNPTANILLNCKKLKAFQPRSGKQQGCPVPLLLLKVLATKIRQEAKNKKHPNWKEVKLSLSADDVI